MDLDSVDGGGNRGVRKRVIKIKSTNKLVQKLKEFMIQKGWRKLYIDKVFGNLSDFEIDYETFEFYMTKFARMWFSSINTELCEETLYQIGLSKIISRRLYKVIEPLTDASYTNEQLFDYALEYLLGTFLPISTVDTQYFVKDIPEDEWINHDQYGYCFNISKSKTEWIDYNRLEKAINEIHRKDHTIFYHCTNWKNSLNIINNGPSNHFGRKCLDFGIRPSFYLTPNIDVALSWGLKSNSIWGKEVAILAFHVSDKILKSRQNSYKVKFFENATDEWKQLTSSSRRCQVNKNELDDYHFVYGPMLANVPKIHIEDAKAHKPIKYQLASKKDKTERYLKKNYIGTIWLNKQFNP